MRLRPAKAIGDFASKNGGELCYKYQYLEDTKYLLSLGFSLMLVYCYHLDRQLRARKGSLEVVSVKLNISLKCSRVVKEMLKGMKVSY